MSEAAPNIDAEFVDEPTPPELHHEKIDKAPLIANLPDPLPLD